MAIGRRGFIGAGLAGSGLLAAEAGAPMTEKEKLDRIASNTWPIRHIFKGWPNVKTGTQTFDSKMSDDMKKLSEHENVKKKKLIKELEK